MNNVHFAIPEIYGETLSYYELLRKLVDKTNDLIDNYNTVPEQIAEAVANLDASQLFSEVLNQLIHSIATDNTKSVNAVKVYKKHDLLYATFNETVNLYESLIDFTTGTETELIVGTNIREVNISELFIELRKLIDINKNNIDAVTSVANENSTEITTIHNDITDIENKNTEQDNELTTLRTMISSPYNFKGDVANISSLPASGEVNDTYYAQDVKYKVTWTGSAWVQSSLSEADYETELSELKGDLDNEITRATNRENEIESLFTMPTQEAVNNWLNDHPEATTTVQDHSLTIDKMVIGTLGYVTPEMFGAVGDGVNDDFKALKNAFDSGKPVYLSKSVYYCPHELILPNSSKLYGNGGTIKGVSLFLSSNNVVKDISISNGYLSLNTDKLNGNIRNVYLNNIVVNTSADSAISVIAGGNGNNSICNICFDRMTLDGAFNTGIKFVINYSNNSSKPWITSVKVSNVFIGQFENAILFDIGREDETYQPQYVAMNGFIFSNIRGQWTTKSKAYVKSNFAVSDVTFDEVSPFDFVRQDGNYLFDIVSLIFENTELRNSNWKVTGTSWMEHIYQYSIIRNATTTSTKAKDFYEIFYNTPNREDFYDNTIFVPRNNQGRDTSYKYGAMGVRQAPTSSWKDQAKGQAECLLGTKYLHSTAYGGDNPIVGASHVGIPFINDGAGNSYFILSNKYMPYYLEGNTTYNIPSNPVIGYMMFNKTTNKPMWYNGQKWIYADGSDAI